MELEDEARVGECGNKWMVRRWVRGAILRTGQHARLGSRPVGEWIRWALWELMEGQEPSPQDFALEGIFIRLCLCGKDCDQCTQAAGTAHPTARVLSVKWVTYPQWLLEEVLPCIRGRWSSELKRRGWRRVDADCENEKGGAGLGAGTEERGARAAGGRVSGWRPEAGGC